jgi:hypothetical protein
MVERAWSRAKRVRLGVVAFTLIAASLSSTGAAVIAQETAGPPNRVLIVLFDQMLPGYANRFDMPNYRAIRDAGTNFKKAYLGYMASETVIAHNVITSGLLPKHMGWTDEAYRDTQNLLGFGAGEMHITGDLSLADFGTLIGHEDYPKLADYLHAAYPGKEFIVVGEKSYAVESAVAPTGDIGVRMSGRSSSSLLNDCRTLLGGRYRSPAGKNVPSYLLTGPLTEPNPPCGRYWINSSDTPPFDYGTKDAFPSNIYFEDGNRFFPGTDASALAGHTGGDRWVADAAIAMIENEDWSGMFVTLGGIDKAGHMWGAQADVAPADCSTGPAQTHVACAAAIADHEFGRIIDAVEALDAEDGGDTLVVLTADHGATFGQSFHGRRDLGLSNSNWYYAPVGVWDAGIFTDPTQTPCRHFPTCITSSIYHQPSDDLQDLVDMGNVQFSYQSTAIETWLIDHSVAQKREGAAVILGMPDVIASYWRDGDRYRLFGRNAMTGPEASWWRLHGQELVNSMAADNGPDLIGLLHERVSYGAFGDHGGAQESVQRVPMVFWSSDLAFANDTGTPFRTIDVMPTILQLMGITQTDATDGQARSIE